MVMSGWQGSEPCKGIPACSSQRAWLPVLPASLDVGRGSLTPPQAALVCRGCDLTLPFPPFLLQAAGNAVKRASDNLVKAAQKAAAFQDHDETVVVKEKMVGGIAQVRSRAALVGQGRLWLPVCLSGAGPTTHQYRACLERALQKPYPTQCQLNTVATPSSCHMYSTGHSQ